MSQFSFLLMLKDSSADMAGHRSVLPESPCTTLFNLQISGLTCETEKKKKVTMFPDSSVTIMSAFEVLAQPVKFKEKITLFPIHCCLHVCVYLCLFPYFSSFFPPLTGQSSLTIFYSICWATSTASLKRWSKRTRRIPCTCEYLTQLLW